MSSDQNNETLLTYCSNKDHAIAKMPNMLILSQCCCIIYCEPFELVQCFLM